MTEQEPVAADLAVLKRMVELRAIYAAMFADGKVPVEVDEIAGETIELAADLVQRIHDRAVSPSPVPDGMVLVKLAELEDDDGFSAPDDVMQIGHKVIEMAERVRRLSKAVPGSVAAWAFEMDDDRFEVRVLFKESRDG